jgi:hypothetical protein
MSKNFFFERRARCNHAWTI